MELLDPCWRQVYVSSCQSLPQRKYTQDVKDDIGDGSVFRFQRMNPDEQEQLLRALDLRKEPRV
jgi:hypothetical protein